MDVEDAIDTLENALSDAERAKECASSAEGDASQAYSEADDAHDNIRTVLEMLRKFEEGDEEDIEDWTDTRVLNMYDQLEKEKVKRGI